MSCRSKIDTMFILCVGGFLMIQTYCMPISNKVHLNKPNSVRGSQITINAEDTPDSHSSKRQYEIDCTDTKCSWRNHGNQHDTHGNDCGIDIHCNPRSPL